MTIGLPTTKQRTCVMSRKKLLTKKEKQSVRGQVIKKWIWSNTVADL